MKHYLMFCDTPGEACDWEPCEANTNRGAKREARLKFRDHSFGATLWVGERDDETPQVHVLATCNNTPKGRWKSIKR